MKETSDLNDISALRKEWEKIKFPVKPAQGHLALYEKIITKTCSLSENPKVVFLGSNPDIRDLCLKHNCNVTTTCKDETTLSITSMLMKHKNHPREKKIVVEWKKLPLRDHSYDLVLADVAFAMSPLEDYKPMLKEIKRILKPNGFCAIRKGSIAEDYKQQNTKELIEKWRNNEISLPDFIFHTYIPKIDIEKQEAGNFKT